MSQAFLYRDRGAWWRVGGPGFGGASDPECAVGIKNKTKQGFTGSG